LDGLDWWEHELAARKTTFFSGSEAAGMLDYCLWPWFERLDMYQVHKERKYFWLLGIKYYLSFI
jgi:hypothetical protein